MKRADLWLLLLLLVSFLVSSAVVFLSTDAGAESEEENGPEALWNAVNDFDAERVPDVYEMWKAMVERYPPEPLSPFEPGSVERAMEM